MIEFNEVCSRLFITGVLAMMLVVIYTGLVSSFANRVAIALTAGLLIAFIGLLGMVWL